jgi:hypothetical protein
MFKKVQNVRDEINDKVEKYFSLNVITLSLFIDVMEWWTMRKDMFPAHYQMATDYLGMLATLTPSKCVNNVARRKFMAARQSLSSFVFI